MAGPYYFDVSQAPYNVVGNADATPSVIMSNTTQVQKAITDAAAAGSANTGTDTNATVFFPAGQYILNQLNLPAGVTLQGVGSGGYGVSNLDVPGYPATVLKLASGQNKHFITINDTFNYQKIYDIAFDGSKTNNSAGDVINIADGVNGQECQVRLERIFVFNSPGNGIYVGHNRRAVKIMNSSINYSAIDGVQVAASDATIQNNIIGSNVRANICLGTNTGVHWGAGSAPQSAAVTHVLNNDIYGNTLTPFTQVGIALCLGSWGCVIMNNGIDRHQLEGISCYDGTTNVLHGNVFHSNGMLTNNAYGHIGLGVNVASVCIDCNSFGPHDGGLPNNNLPNWAVFNQSSKGATAVTGNYGVIFPGSVVGTTNSGLHN